LETPVFDPRTGVSKLFDPKTGFFDSKTGNYFQTYFRTIFTKLSQVQKVWVFLKKL